MRANEGKIAQVYAALNLHNHSVARLVPIKIRKSGRFFLSPIQNYTSSAAQNPSILDKSVDLATLQSDHSNGEFTVYFLCNVDLGHSCSLSLLPLCYTG